jgi:SAM-dependent methyltransferase
MARKWPARPLRMRRAGRLSVIGIQEEPCFSPRLRASVVDVLFGCASAVLWFDTLNSVSMEWFENDDFWREFYPFMFSDERFAATPDEVSRILALTQCSGGSVLDLCCGPGRHSVEFAQRGFKVTGVDRSPFLLEKAREHAAKSGASVQWIEQDMREFVRPASFDLACSLFTSFGYFEDEQDDLRVLRNIHQSLEEKGVLIIEVLGKERLARVWKDTMCNELADGSLIFQRPQIRDDWTRIRSEWTLVKESHSRSFTFEHTIYSGRELKDRLLSCGFKQVQLFGDLQGSRYDLDAMRLVAVARKSVS